MRTKIGGAFLVSFMLASALANADDANPVAPAPPTTIAAPPSASSSPIANSSPSVSSSPSAPPFHAWSKPLVATEIPPPAVRYESRWYGWQTLLADVGAVGIGFASKEPALGALAYGIVPPIIHWSHGNVGRGFASLGLRVLTPVATAFIGVLVGAAIASGNRSSQPLDALGDELGGFLIGAGVGYVAAVTIDAAALSWDHDPVKVEEAPPKPRAFSSLSITPRLAMTPKGGAQMGLGGSF